MSVQKELVAIYNYEVPVPEDPFPSDLRSINALNYLQVPSTDWNGSSYIQHLMMPTR